MAIDTVSRLLILSCHEPGCFYQLGADDNYKHVTQLLLAFLIQNLHRAKFFLSKTSVIFLKDMLWFYSTATAVNENKPATEVVGIRHTALWLKDRPLALSIFAQCRTESLKKGLKIPGSSADPMQVRRRV